MWFLAFLAAATIVNAQSTLPIEVDPRCKKMDNDQWQAFEKKEVVRKLAFAGLGIPADRAYTEVLFGHETKTQFNYNYFCAEGWNAVFEPSSELQCNPTTVDLIDKSNNAPGTVTINVQSGTKTSTTLTETDSLATAAGVSMTMSGSIPLVGKVSTTVSFTETYTKTYGKSQTFETNTLTSISRAINIGSGNSNCTAKLTTTTCQHEARGKYPIVAVGWVGWRLKDELTFNGEKARRWYVWIENFPRQEREGHQRDHLEAPLEARSSDRLLRDWRASARAEIPDNADELQTPEQKLSRAKAAVPDHLKDKIMKVGDTLIVPCSYLSRAGQLDEHLRFEKLDRVKGGIFEAPNRASIVMCTEAVLPRLYPIGLSPTTFLHSLPALPSEKLNTGLLVTADLDAAIQRCKAKVETIAKDCRARNRRFRDVEFDLVDDRDRCLHSLDTEGDDPP
ncbi:hypothetical protein RHS01_08229 [Rhizoctonia solani]|uniref:Uncharacterized protein n=1 Tax=Rhizoctonia solani TaxID=456999 RepID=A0A8H7I5L1_9AGAM|nr:hypothetical protein RHS01_08229 [Rhizoctonia solani]